MSKISGLGFGEFGRISGLGLGSIKKVSGLGLGLIWQQSAPTYLGYTQNASNTASANITLTYPTSSSGDFLVFFAGFQRVPTSGTQTIAVPSGWTQAVTQANSVDKSHLFSIAIVTGKQIGRAHV